jgi:hypothetical protein
MNDFITRFHAQAHGREILSAEAQLRIAVNLLEEASVLKPETTAGETELVRSSYVAETTATIVRLERENKEREEIIENHRAARKKLGRELAKLRQTAETLQDENAPSSRRNGDGTMAKQLHETPARRQEAKARRRELGYYNEDEYRVLLGITLGRFRNKESAGELAPCSKVGREKLYRISDVEAWIARHRVQRGASRGAASAAA